MQERTIRVKNPFTGEIGEPETFYFQLNKSDAMDMKLLERDDVEEYLRSVIEGQNGAKMLKVARDMILAAVGVKVGQNLVKEDVAQRFVNEGYWNALFQDLFETEGYNPMDFIIGILPEDIQKEIAEGHEKKYTEAELLAMTDKEFYKAVGTKNVSEMEPRHLQIAVRRKTHKSDAA